MADTARPPAAPASIAPGLRVRFARARIRPGMEAEAERWMQMLNDRHGECVQTLERERMAITGGVSSL